MWTNTWIDNLSGIPIMISEFSNDERFISSRIFTIKICCGIPQNLYKLFAVCYLFGNLHDQVIWNLLFL